MPTGKGQSMKNEQVRLIGRQIEDLEDQIAAATAQDPAADTAALKQQLADLEAQMKAAQQAKQDAQHQAVADSKAARDAAGHGKSAQAPGKNKP